MKLDLSILRYMQREEFRVLTAVEMGMKNHDQVPNELIDQISGLKSGGTYKILCLLHKNKLLHHENKQYDSYRLTPMGYDYLALNAFRQRDSVTNFGKQIGVGKEADIYLVSNDEAEALCCKIHRLGRTSFRNIKAQRDYLLHRKSASWLYLSRLSAVKEYAFMRVLYEHGFPVPEPIDHSRHIVIMRLIEGTQLNQIAELGEPERVYDTCMSLIVRLGKVGLIHSDFNEFNLMVDEEQTVTVIDFPQMVSISHRNAKFYFDRDVDCIVTFFEKRFGFTSEKPRPSWEGVLAARQGTLDVISAASGYIGEKEIAEFEKAGGLGERFGDGEGDREVADITGEDDGDEDEDEEEEDSRTRLREENHLSGASVHEPAVVNHGTGQGGEKVIERDEDVQFHTLRQAEALALRRLAEDSSGNMYSSQLEPEPDEADFDGEGGQAGQRSVPRLGDESKVLEIKRPERDKCGHRKDAAQARLERLAQLSGEQIENGDADEDMDGDSKSEDDEDDEGKTGLERTDVAPNVAPGKVHFIKSKETQKQGGEPEEDDHRDGVAPDKSNRPRYARGGGRRAPPKQLTAEEQAALIRKRVAKTKSGRPRNGGGRGGHERGNGKKASKAKNASNKNVKAMMQSI